MSLISPNPVLSNGFAHITPSMETMTLAGTVRRCWMLIALTIGSALGAVGLGLSQALVLPAALVAFVLVLVSLFRPHLARFTAPLYAVLEGVVVGLISQWYARAYGGDIVLYSVGVTVCVFLAMLMLYATKLIKPTENFKLGVFAATAGIALYYLAAVIGSFVGFQMPLIASNSLFGVGFSLLVVAIAAANLVIDFDFIEKGAASGAPRHMEWFAAQGLLVTLVWLYLEILRLLAKLRDR